MENPDNKKPTLKVTSLIVPVAAIVLLFIGSKIFGFMGGLSLTLFLLLIVSVGRSISDELFGKSTPKIRKSMLEKIQTKSDILSIIVYIMAVRCVSIVFAYIVSKCTGTTSGGFFQAFERTWLNSGIDAPSYLGIAQNWYVTEGDPMYHIVFFPLYPILIKLFYFILRDYLLAALAVNMCASLCAGVMAYKLAMIDFDRKTSLRFVKYIFILPAAFFYIAPMTESLFLLLCICCIYFARTRRFLLCAAFGMLAAFTRSQGILLGLPCVYIAIQYFIGDIKKGVRRKTSVTKLVGNLCCSASIALGLLAYLFINYKVWGNAFQFSIFQKEHWSQSFGVFPNTVTMIFNYMLSTFNSSSGTFLTNYELKKALALWLPQVIYIFASLIICLLAVRKIHSSYTLFFVAYFIVSIGATWLLSAPRYLMACVSLPMAITALTDKKAVDIVATGVCVVLSAAYLFMYAASSPIY